MLHTKLFYIVFFTLALTIGSENLFSQEIPQKKNFEKNEKTIEINSDGKIIIQDTITKKDSTHIAINDTIKKKPLLEGIVTRKAKDYEKANQKTKELTLYNEAELYYTDIELKAGIIVLNYDKNEVYAGRIKDTSGNYIQRPIFKQGANIIEPDSIRFNFKTKKALVWNSRTQQSEMNIKSEITKRENDSVYFLKNARITTAKDIDDPEYYFFVSKVKFVPKKKVVVGPTNLVIADVPTPLILPFAYFPMTEKSTSGFIVPTPGQSNQQGYFLQNGGYYFALSDYYDLAILGDYYTNGSYGLRFESSYAKRYKFNGRVSFRIENNIQSERGLPDYFKSSNYNFQWSHNQDPKAAANSRFSASVQLGSSQYFRQSVNLANVGSGLNNNMSSSISYNKTFQTVPQVNLSLTATHNQNTNTEIINMTLPTLQANVDRIFPFAPREGTKKGFFKNINLQYSLRGENRIVTSDEFFLKQGMFDNAKAGFNHSIPLNTNFKIMKYFSVSMGGNFNEVWVFNTIRKKYDSSENKVINTDVNGFDAFRTYNFNTNIGTTIYGTFNFKETNRIQALRHVIKPSLAYSYAPSFERYYDTYAIDATGTTLEDYSRFEGGLFGAPGKTYSSSIALNVNNTFEAKVKDKENDTPKKIMLLNNLTFNTIYNLAADSLALSPLRVSGGTQIFKQKMGINFGATLDPYAIDNSGRRINTFNIDNGGSLFRFTSANLTINYSLSSSDTKKSKGSEQTARNGGREDDLFGVGTDLSDNRQSLFNKDEDEKEEEGTLQWYSTKLPWDFTLAYSATYNNSNRQNEISSNSLMVSGNIELAPRWKVGVSSGYDFKQKGVTFTQLRFERDLESWRMSFNWVPFGTYTYWGFFIGIKSSMLSDIKWEKRQLPDRILR